MAVLAPPRRRPSPPPTARDGGVLRLTERAYLARERDPARALEPRSELFANGEVREMAGARRPHELLVDRLNKAIDRFAGDGGWEFYAGGMKFRPPRCRYFYPDLMVTPAPPAMPPGADDVVLNPVFVAEVLSDSTEEVDRGEKQDCYRNTPSVLEYWLLAQDRVRVERHHRPDGDATWGVDLYEDRAGEVPLPARGGAVSLATLYRQAVPAG